MNDAQSSGAAAVDYLYSQWSPSRVSRLRAIGSPEFVRSVGDAWNAPRGLVEITDSADYLIAEADGPLSAEWLIHVTSGMRPAAGVIVVLTQAGGSEVRRATDAGLVAVKLAPPTTAGVASGAVTSLLIARTRGSVIPQISDIRRAPVSVIIPLFNHEKYVETTLLSVAQQTRPPEEVIVIDDGSTDRSLELVNSMRDLVPGLIFWRHDNRGAHATLNSAMHRATQPFISILNSDDIYEPRRLERCLAAQSELDADLVVTAAKIVDQNGAEQRNEWYEAAVTFFEDVGHWDLALINANFVLTTSNFFMKAELARSLGGFDDLRYAHDLDFLLRAVQSKGRLSWINEPLYCYRYHSNNTISEDHNAVRVEWAYAAAAHLWRASVDPCDLPVWPRYLAVMDVLRRHNLERAVLMMTTVFAQQRGRVPNFSAIKASPALQPALHQALA